MLYQRKAGKPTKRLAPFDSLIRRTRAPGTVVAVASIGDDEAASGVFGMAGVGRTWRLTLYMVELIWRGGDDGGL